jgi:hypothetical protein
MTGRWKPFPGTNALGSYDYFGQTIDLRSVDRDDLKRAVGNQELPAQLKVNEFICRVPFSVASLLEARAMASELFIGMELCNRAGNDPVKMVDANNWIEKLKH